MAASPHRFGMGALQILQIGENVSEMFGVAASASACLHEGTVGS